MITIPTPRCDAARGVADPGLEGEGQTDVIPLSLGMELERECFRLAATTCESPIADERGHVGCAKDAKIAVLANALREFIPERQSGTLTEAERFDLARDAFAFGADNRIAPLDSLETAHTEIAARDTRIAELEAALRFYANPESWRAALDEVGRVVEIPHSNASMDGGGRARTALGES